MQFVKASERLPEMPEDIKCSKELALKIDGDYDTGRAYNGSNGVIFCGKKYNVLTEKAFEKIFWLDENPPPPASAVEEAEKLYPFKKVNHELFIGCNDLAKYQQLAHITCAGMYTGEIDKLKAELEQSLLVYNNQTATIFKLEAENSKMRNALEKSLEWIADVKQKDIPLDDKKGMALYHIKWLITEALK